MCVCWAGVAQGVVTGIRGLCNGLGPAMFGCVFYMFHVNLSEDKKPIPVKPDNTSIPLFEGTLKVGAVCCVVCVVGQGRRKNFKTVFFILGVMIAFCCGSEFDLR